MIDELNAILGSLAEGNDSKKAGWQTLAKANNLDFIRVRPTDFREAYVAGDYRGHYLILETVIRSEGVWTRIVLLADYPLSDPVLAKGDDDSNHDPALQNPLDLLLAPEFDHTPKGTIRVRPYGQQITYEQPGIEDDVTYLQSIFDLLCDLIEAHPKLIALGSVSVPSLLARAAKNMELNLVVRQMIEDIGHETAAQWAANVDELLCPYCLVRCAAHDVYFPAWTASYGLTYYGCRTCHQSQRFLVCKGQVVATLDRELAVELFQQENVLRVNWLSRQALFDFESVEIVHTSDEEVERFAVQVGNDTDPIRKSRYQAMHCAVALDCELSKNTVRILQRTFGTVSLNRHLPAKVTGQSPPKIPCLEIAGLFRPVQSRSALTQDEVSLSNYIRQARQEGLTTYQIACELRASDWTLDRIAAAFLLEYKNSSAVSRRVRSMKPRSGH